MISVTLETKRLKQMWLFILIAVNLSIEDVVTFSYSKSKPTVCFLNRPAVQSLGFILKPSHRICSP